jgi:hypothetical protein
LVVHSAAAARVDACLAVALSSFLSAAALCRCSLLLLALLLDYRTNHARGCNVIPIAVCTDTKTFEMVVLKDATLPQALSAVAFALRLFVQTTAWRSAFLPAAVCSANVLTRVIDIMRRMFALHIDSLSSAIRIS